MNYLKSITMFLSLFLLLSVSLTAQDSKSLRNLDKPEKTCGQVANGSGQDAGSCKGKATKSKHKHKENCKEAKAEHESKSSCKGKEAKLEKKSNTSCKGEAEHKGEHKSEHKSRSKNCN